MVMQRSLLLAQSAQVVAAVQSGPTFMQSALSSLVCVGCRDKFWSPNILHDANIPKSMTVNDSETDHWKQPMGGPIWKECINIYKFFSERLKCFMISVVLQVAYYISK